MKNDSDAPCPCHERDLRCVNCSGNNRLDHPCSACRCQHPRCAALYEGVNAPNPTKPVTDAQLAEGDLLAYMCLDCNALLPA